MKLKRIIGLLIVLLVSAGSLSLTKTVKAKDGYDYYGYIKLNSNGAMIIENIKTNEKRVGFCIDPDLVFPKAGSRALYKISSFKNNNSTENNLKRLFSNKSDIERLVYNKVKGIRELRGLEEASKNNVLQALVHWYTHGKLAGYKSIDQRYFSDPKMRKILDEAHAFLENKAIPSNIKLTVFEPQDKKNQRIVTFEKKKYPKIVGDLKTSVKVGTQTGKADKSVGITAEQARLGVQIQDIVTYTKLSPKTDYKLQGRLMHVTDKEEVEEIAVSKAQVVKTSETGSGEWVVVFDNIKNLQPGERYVVYETAESVEKLTYLNNSGEEVTQQHKVEHSDKKDNAQTVVVEREKPTFDHGPNVDTDEKLPNEQGQSGNIIEQEDSKTLVKFSKRDLKGNELVGATIELRDLSGKSIQSWVSDGKAKDFYLLPGNYEFVETAAPEGYQIATKIMFTISTDGRITVDGQLVTGTAHIVMVDNYKPIVETGDVIDIEENLPNEHGQSGSTEIIEENHIIETEQSLPNEHGQSGSTEIIEENHIIETEQSLPNEHGQSGDHTIVEDTKPELPGKHNIKISKLNLGGQEIGGAQIEIRAIDGSMVTGWTSIVGQTHYLELAAGTYIFHEVVAPNGYLKVTDITFKVDDNGQVTIIDAAGNTVATNANHLMVTDHTIPTIDQPEVPKTPNQSKSKLPATGDVVSSLASLLGLNMLAVSMFVFVGRKKYSTK